MSLIACLSPLLVAAHLWQIKEWRIDRLDEHLTRESWFLQLFGVVRPVVVLLSIGILLIPGMPIMEWARIGAGVLAILTFVRILLRRQSAPVPTQKALTLIFTSLLLDLALLVWVSILGRTVFAVCAVFLPVFQWITLMAAWALWVPVDRMLKNHVFAEARALREAQEDLTVIGITGSVGKTTSKELIAHVLKPLGVAATPAYVNTEMGVAQWLTKTLRTFDHPQILIVEMGAYRIGEIALLCSVAQPTMSVVTYVGNQHLALFGSSDNVFKAKSEIVTSLPATGHAFLNGDNEQTRKMKDLAPCPVTIVGTGGKADLEAFDIAETPKGLSFRAGSQQYDVPLHGTHNVTNVLLAIAVAQHLGMKEAEIAKELRTFTPLKRTFEVRSQNGIDILDDTHNSSVPSLKAATAWAKAQPYDQKVLLAAGLIELGEDFAPAHRELGMAARGVFDRVIFIDPQSARLFQEGLGKAVEMLSKDTVPITKGTLLVCTGRMPESTIKRLLPHSHA